MRRLLAVPALLAAALVSFIGAAPVSAQQHRGGQYSGARSYSGQSYSGRNQNYSRGSAGGQNYSNRGSNGGQYYSNGRNYGGNSYRYNGGGREYGEHRHGRGWGDYGRGSSFSFGFYSAPRAYYYDPLPYYGSSYYVAPTYCNPNGFYDSYGYWHPDPNCAVDSYGY